MKKKDAKILYQFLKETDLSLAHTMRTLADLAWGSDTLEGSIQLQLIFSELYTIKKALEHNIKEFDRSGR
jgi:hypothetical protein